MIGKTEQVRIKGAQLFDANGILKSQIAKGVVSINSNGKIVLNGVINVNNRAFTVTLQPGTYTLSADKPSTWHIIAPVDGLFDKTLVVDAETTYNCYISNGTYDNVETTPMINAGSSALSWEPYTGGQPSPSPDYPQPIEVTDQPVVITVKGGTESQSITLTPPRPFTKWDRLEKIDGVWMWVYNSKMVDSTGLTPTDRHSSGAFITQINNFDKESLCNKLICKQGLISALVNGEYLANNGLLFIKVDAVDTLDDFKQWIKNNNPEFLYKTITPEYIPLAASEQAQLNSLTMYAPETEITNNGGCTMDLTYTADTKTYIDNKLAAISAAMIGGT